MEGHHVICWGLSQWFCYKELWWVLGPILWKIVSPSLEPMSSSYNIRETTSPKVKMLGSLCNQTVNMKTDSKILYYSTLKLKYRPSILKHNKGKKKFASLNNSNNNKNNNIIIIKNLYCAVFMARWSTEHKWLPQKLNKQDIYYEKSMFRSINQSLHPTGHMPWIILRLWGFLYVREAGCRGNKITAFPFLPPPPQPWQNIHSWNCVAFLQNLVKQVTFPQFQGSQQLLFHRDEGGRRSSCKV